MRVTLASGLVSESCRNSTWYSYMSWCRFVYRYGCLLSRWFATPRLATFGSFFLIDFFLILKCGWTYSALERVQRSATNTAHWDWLWKWWLRTIRWRSLVIHRDLASNLRLSMSYGYTCTYFDREYISQLFKCSYLELNPVYFLIRVLYCLRTWNHLCFLNWGGRQTIENRSNWH